MEEEKFGTTINGIDWEIDLERKRLVSIKNPKIIRRLDKSEVKRIRELINLREEYDG